MPQRTKELYPVESEALILELKPFLCRPVLKGVLVGVKSSMIRRGGRVYDPKLGTAWTVAHSQNRNVNSMTSTCQMTRLGEEPGFVVLRARSRPVRDPVTHRRIYDQNGVLVEQPVDLMANMGTLAWKREGISRLDLISIGTGGGLEPPIVTAEMVANMPDTAEALLASAIRTLTQFVPDK